MIYFSSLCLAAFWKWLCRSWHVLCIWTYFCVSELLASFNILCVPPLISWQFSFKIPVLGGQLGWKQRDSSDNFFTPWIWYLCSFWEMLCSLHTKLAFSSPQAHLSALSRSVLADRTLQSVFLKKEAAASVKWLSLSVGLIDIRSETVNGLWNWGTDCSGENERILGFWSKDDKFQLGKGVILATKAYGHATYPGKKIQFHCYYIAILCSNIFTDSHSLIHFDFFPTPVLQFCIQGSCHVFLNLNGLNNSLNLGSSLNTHC